MFIGYIDIYYTNNKKDNKILGVYVSSYIDEKNKKSVENMIKEFNVRVKKAGIIEEYKDRMYFKTDREKNKFKRKK